MADRKTSRPKSHPRRWLLFRGLAREVRHWGVFPKLLQKAFPNDEVHCLDLPGAGVHFRERCPFTMAKMREQLRAEWLELGKPGPNDVILGLSLGGMLALDWAGAHRKDFSTIVAINSSVGGLNPPWQRMTPYAMKQILRIATIRNPKQREKAIAEMVNHRKLSAAEIKERAGYCEDAPMAMRNTIAQMVSALSFRLPKLGEKAHLIIVRSLGDRLCNPLCSEKLAAHFRATLQTHPTAGHDVPVDEPQWLVDRLKENV